MALKADRFYRAVTQALVAILAVERLEIKIIHI
jgi:hypothetical protein